jgi:hypothetical protein
LVKLKQTVPEWNPVGLELIIESNWILDIHVFKILKELVAYRTFGRMFDKKLEIHLSFSCLKNQAFNLFKVLLFFHRRRLFLNVLKIFYKGFLFAAFWDLWYFFDGRHLKIPLVDEIHKVVLLFNCWNIFMEEMLSLTVRSRRWVRNGIVAL